MLPNQICTITEGEGTSCLWEGSSSTKEELPGLVFFNIHPNPVSAKNILIQYEVKEVDTVSLSLFDLNGQLLQHHSILNNGTFQMNVGEMGAGVYIVTLQTDRGIVSKKVTIQ